jgi:Holliday junction resolvase
MPERVINRLMGIAELRRQKLGERKVNFNGIPDVIGWRRDDLIMLECKRAKADRLRTNQETWMHCAILFGCSITQLGVFEWHFDQAD